MARRRRRRRPAAVRHERADAQPAAAREDVGAAAARGRCARLRRAGRRHPGHDRRQLPSIDGVDAHATPGEGAGADAVGVRQQQGAERAGRRRARPAVRRELPHHPGHRAGRDRRLPRRVPTVGRAVRAVRGGVRRRRGGRRHRHRASSRVQLRPLGVLDPRRRRRHPVSGSRHRRSADRRAARGGKGPHRNAIRRRCRRGRRQAGNPAARHRGRRAGRHVRHARPLPTGCAATN